jgi:hypothetical protein
VSEYHVNPISNWYGSVGKDVQASFDILITELTGTEDWDSTKKPKYRLLDREHKGLCELIFKVDSRKFRVLGVMFKEVRIFTLFTGCSHSRQGNDPPTAFDDARKFKNLLDQGRGTTREHY